MGSSSRKALTRTVDSINDARPLGRRDADAADWRAHAVNRLQLALTLTTGPTAAGRGDPGVKFVITQRRRDSPDSPSRWYRSR